MKLFQSPNRPGNGRVAENETSIEIETQAGAQASRRQLVLRAARDLARTAGSAACAWNRRCPAQEPPRDTVIGLALLRAELCCAYGARQFWLQTSPDASARHQLDCCVVPPRCARQKANDDEQAVRAVPTVLFCSPNAVLSGVLSISDSTWRCFESG